MTARGQFFFNPPEPTGFNATTLGLVQDANGDNSVVIGIKASAGVGAANAVVIGANSSGGVGRGRVIIGANITDVGDASSGANAGGITIASSDSKVVNIAAGCPQNIAIVIPTSNPFGLATGSKNVWVGTINAGLAQTFGTSNVGIGTNPDVGRGTSSNCVAIGNGCGTGTNGSSIAIGSSVSALASSSIGIGSSVNISSAATNSIAIGASASTNNSLAVAGIAIGASATVSTINGVALGASSSNNSKNYAFGVLAGRPGLAGALAFQPTNNAPFAAVGNSQWEIASLAASTTTATLTEALGANSDRLVMLNNSGWFFKAYVMAHRSDAQGDHMAWEYSGAISRGATASTTALIGTPASSVFNTATLAWSVAISADTTNGALVFNVTGEASKTIKWLIRVDTVEMTA